MHYGPGSYFELGRSYPRDELRRPFDRQHYRRVLAVALIPSIPPPPLATPIPRAGLFGSAGLRIGLPGSAGRRSGLNASPF